MVLNTEPNDIPTDAELQYMFIDWECHKFYKETNNPLFAWEAFNKAYKHKLPPPDWALNVIIETSERMMAAASDSGPPKLTEVLGFSTKKDFNLYRKHKEKDEIASFVSHLNNLIEDDPRTKAVKDNGGPIQIGPKTLDATCEILAEKYHKTPAWVKNEYYKWSKPHKTNSQ